MTEITHKFKRRQHGLCVNNLPQVQRQEEQELEAQEWREPAAFKRPKQGQNSTKTFMQTHESEEEEKSFNLHEETLRR